MGKVSQRIRSTKTTIKTKTVKSTTNPPKSAKHPVDCCVHKTHSKKP